VIISLEKIILQREQEHCITGIFIRAYFMWLGLRIGLGVYAEVLGLG